MGHCSQCGKKGWLLVLNDNHLCKSCATIVEEKVHEQLLAKLEADARAQIARNNLMQVDAKKKDRKSEVSSPATTELNAISKKFTGSYDEYYNILIDIAKSGGYDCGRFKRDPYCTPLTYVYLENMPCFEIKTSGRLRYFFVYLEIENVTCEFVTTPGPGQRDCGTRIYLSSPQDLYKIEDIVKRAIARRVEWLKRFDCDCDSDSFSSKSAETINTTRIQLNSTRDLNEFKSYVVLDCETTGLSPVRDEIIEFAAVQYVDGAFSKEYHQLIKPSIPLPRAITQLTGITDSDLADAPCIADVIGDMWDFLQGFPLVAHNAAFDMGFLKEAFLSASFTGSFGYVDTLCLARTAYPELPNHKLATLISCLNLAGEQTHRALDDVLCTQKLLRLCIERLIAKKEAEDASAQATEAAKKRKSLAPRFISAEDLKPSSVFLCKKIVFTGTLSITRDEAACFAEEAGAIIRNTVTRQTDYLIVGAQNAALVGDDGVSGKEAKAVELNKSGQASIKIIDETAFLKLIESMPTAEQGC